jgi:hypothetical protein
MEIITAGSFEFSDSFGRNVEDTASKMIEQELNVLEIPNSEGLILVRVGSDEEERRKGSQMPIAPYERHGNIFIVCTK